MLSVKFIIVIKSSHRLLAMKKKVVYGGFKMAIQAVCDMIFRMMLKIGRR